MSMSENIEQQGFKMNTQDQTHNHDESGHEHSESELADKKAALPQVGRQNEYWVNLDHYNNNPQFWKQAEAEFQSSPLRGEKEEGWARREFLKLMGASVAMGAAGCVRRPVQKIVPYVKQPEEVTLGVANYYTGAATDGIEPLSLLVRTREGRPLKIEGNPEFPLTKGGTSARAQASLMSLYDPERLKGPRKNLFNEKKTNKDTIHIKWDEMDDQITAQLKKGSVAVLTGAIASPSTRSIIKEFNQAFGGKHYVWETLNYSDVVEGQEASYGGDGVFPYYHFDKTKMIVSIDADFLGAWGTPTASARAFSKRRKDTANMTRLVSFDSSFSLTGANADIRLRIKPSQQLKVVLGLAYEVVVKKGQSSYSSQGNVKSLLEKYADVPSEIGVDSALFAQIAQDLWDSRGESIVVAGGLPTLNGNSLSLQIAVNFLNSVLGNDGKTIDSKNHWVGASQGSWSGFFELIESMKKGQVKTLIIHRVNPIFSLPETFGFHEALKKVETVVYTGDRMDETGGWSHFVAPDNHAMENWGDAEFTKGLFAVHQPTLRPLWDTRSFQLSLMTWAYLANQGPKRLLAYETYFDYLKNYWKEEIAPQVARGQSFENFWQDLLQKGFAGTEPEASGARTFKLDALSKIKANSAPDKAFELVLYPTVQLADGSASNIAMLQELPDPVTKVVWDNYASVSLATAENLKLEEGDLVEVEVAGQKIKLPTHIQPGLHDGVVAVAIGYGRTAAGSVANGIGQNTAPWIQAINNQAVYSGEGADVKKTGGNIQLAITAGHNSMEGRQIVVEATLKDYEKNKGANIHRHHLWSIWSGHQYNGNKWGMAVDLNTCTGCSACVVACQSENNVPSVGKKYVLEGREMHWIRIDRYYKGDPSNPETVFHPVMCQHCDNAPCETVCPVLATNHSDEGTNDMIYNRCVGTRYCSNNCPYKVRRFNWFNFRKEIPVPQHMSFNPDVTVRIRGVMEKCTFCIHKIKEARNKVKLEGRALKDGDVKTACQTACPTDALVFGDMNDGNSKLSQAFKEERAYGLLEEWGAKPSVRYMTKIRNNNKESAQVEHGAAPEGGHS
jgi:MoCo/4Fe-4S cofactor protein with predicted Tat translocation signal